MTYEERELKIHEFYVFIADKFKDIQLRGQELKHPEDKSMTLMPLKKMKDDIDDILRAYGEIEYLEVSDIDEF